MVLYCHKWLSSIRILDMKYLKQLVSIIFLPLSLSSLNYFLFSKCRIVERTIIINESAMQKDRHEALQYEMAWKCKRVQGIVELPFVLPCVNVK